jgi:hypothetical protein
VKSTTPISKIKTEFSLQNATSFGGIKIFLEYLENSSHYLLVVISIS